MVLQLTYPVTGESRYIAWPDSVRQHRYGQMFSEKLSAQFCVSNYSASLFVLKLRFFFNMHSLGRLLIAFVDDF